MTDLGKNSDTLTMNILTNFEVFQKMCQSSIMKRDTIYALSEKQLRLCSARLAHTSSIWFSWCLWRDSSLSIYSAFTVMKLKKRCKRTNIQVINLHHRGSSSIATKLWKWQWELAVSFSCLMCKWSRWWDLTCQLWSNLDSLYSGSQMWSLERFQISSWFSWLWCWLEASGAHRILTSSTLQTPKST